MDEFLCNSKRQILGIVKKESGNRLALYGQRDRQIMGYYDGNKDQTFDSYGKLYCEGNALADLPYVPRKLKFPLPEMSRAAFTKYEIERESREPRVRTAPRQYWDDGKCQVCKKSEQRLCFVQGLPGMCETCYRFFCMYSRTDCFSLEKQSRYRPLKIEEIRKAVDKAKAPFLLAAETADVVTKAVMIKGAKDMVHNVLVSNRENANTNTYANATSAVETKTSPNATPRSHPTTAKKQEKKRGLRWYQWILIFVIGYYLLKVLYAVVIVCIMWKMGYL